MGDDEREPSDSRVPAVVPASPGIANLKPWKPGQSGNPDGSGGKLARQLREYIAGKTREDIDAIRKLAATAKSEFVRLQALTWLAEQVIGKPSLALKLEDEQGNAMRIGIIIMPAERGDSDEEGGDDGE